MASDGSGEQLVNGSYFAAHHTPQGGNSLVHFVNANFWHLQRDSPAGQLRERRGGASVTDIDQFRKRVLMCRSQLHEISTRHSPVTKFSRSLLANPELALAI